MSSNAAARAEDVTLLRDRPLFGAPPPHVLALFERLLPLTYLNLGNRCNLACPYCSVDDHATPVPETGALEDDLARLAGLGLRKVTLIGGEPTLHPDLADLVAHARGLGFSEVNLTTNGLRLADAAFLDDLVAAGLTSVQFSLHAASPELIGRLAGDDRAGTRALAALENLLTRPTLWLFFATLVARPTLAHLPAFVEAVAGWSTRAARPLPVLVTGMLPQSRALANHADVLPSPSAAGRAVQAALERAQALGVPAVHRNLPPCLVPGWEAWSADGCTRNARVRVPTGEILPGQRDVAWHQRLACQRCRWTTACPGVHAGTVAAFGWEDHHPVAPPHPGGTHPPRPEAASWLEQSPGRAVVVGGSGLLGRHVVRRLQGAGWHVTSVSRRGEPEQPGVTVVRADRSAPETIAALLATRPALWIDLAVFDGAGARALAEAWRTGLPTRLVVAGSVAEYGALHRLPSPLPEDAPLTPDDPYGRGKAEAWGVLAEAFAAHGLPVTWAVLPQLWGPGDRRYRDGAWIHAIVQGLPIVLRGDGEARVSDGYAGTAAEGLLHLAGDPTTIGRRAHVSGPDAVSALTYLRLAAEVLRRDATLLLVPGPTLRAVERAAGRRLQAVFPDRDVLVSPARLQAGGFHPSLSAADGVRVTALAHAGRPSPEGAASFALTDDLARRLRERPETRVVRVR